jgi:uncharacterized protein YbjT (DUF2867 family)
MQQVNPIFVTGATGNVGRQVVNRLLAKGVPVRALSRNPDSAGFAPEVELVRGDLENKPEWFERNLDGVEAVFLMIRSPATEAAARFVEVAAKRARRIVFLSSSAVQDGVDHSANPIARMHAEVESIIAGSGLIWTFLRPGGFATNARTWWASQIRSGDVVRWPFGRACSSPIHEADIASVAVRALTEDGNGGAKYHLTGPQSLTLSQQVRAIGDALGRSLRFEEIPPEPARMQLSKVMPPQIVDMLLGFWASTLDIPSPVTQTVAKITGSPARPFHDWAMEHASEFERQAVMKGSL